MTSGGGGATPLSDPYDTAAQAVRDTRQRFMQSYQPQRDQYAVARDRIQSRLPTGTAPGYSFGEAPAPSYNPTSESRFDNIVSGASAPRQPVDGRYAVTGPPGGYARPGEGTYEPMPAWRTGLAPSATDMAANRAAITAPVSRAGVFGQGPYQGRAVQDSNGMAVGVAGDFRGQPVAPGRGLSMYTHPVNVNADGTRTAMTPQDWAARRTAYQTQVAQRNADRVQRINAMRAARAAGQQQMAFGRANPYAVAAGVSQPAGLASVPASGAGPADIGRLISLAQDDPRIQQNPALFGQILQQNGVTTDDLMEWEAENLNSWLFPSPVELRRREFLRRYRGQPAQTARGPQNPPSYSYSAGPTIGG